MANIGYIQVVRHCNHLCGFCSSPTSAFFHTFDSIKVLIDDFVSRGYFGIILTGGEPTLYDDLPKVVSYSRARGLYVRMITNGMRMAKPEFTQALAKAGLQHVHVSVYSHKPEVEEKLRGLPNTLPKAYAAVQNAHEAGITVSVNSTICKPNADHLHESIAYWIEHHPYVRHFIWNNLDPSMGRAGVNQGQFLHTFGECYESLQKAMKLLDDSGRTFRVDKVPLCYLQDYGFAATETRKIIKGEERIVHFLDSKQSVRQTLWDGGYSEACGPCTLREICAGIFVPGGGYSKDELRTQTMDPTPIIERVVLDPHDPSRWSSLEDWRTDFDERIAKQRADWEKLGVAGADRRLREQEQPRDLSVGQVDEQSKRIAEAKKAATARAMEKQGMELEDGAEIVPIINEEPAGGRLMLRLNVTCNLGCRFCTIADIAHLDERGTNDAVKEMDKGRQEGCTELVFMRGEPTLRKDLAALIRYARTVGYRLVQVQTNGRMFYYRRYLRSLLKAGATFFEVSLFGHNAELNDRLTRVDGSFEQTETGIKNLVVEGAAHMVTVPVVKGNFEHLTAIVERLAELGTKQVQLNFSRPVLLDGEWNTEPLVTLTESAPHIRKALARGRELGLHLGTEAVPLCHLEPGEAERQGMGGDVGSDFGSFRVADLHRHTESMAEHRETSRPKAPECSGCRYETICPRTWQAYQEIHGTREFHPIPQEKPVDSPTAAAPA